jgi:predicted PurR-regulated permease PerM
MHHHDSTVAKPRVAFLLLLALGITLLFFWVIKGFLMAIVLAAVFAAMLSPFYRRVTGLLGGREAIASGLTVVLTVFLVIIPMLLFFGILIDQAIAISAAASDWIANISEQSEGLQQRLGEDPYLQQLLPYQDEVIEKAGQAAARVGTYVAQGLVAGATGTASFLLMLFVMLYAVFFFLIQGSTIVDAALRFTPLTDDDKARLLGTFTSVGRATVKGTLIIGIVQGSLAGLSFYVAGIQGPVFWGAVMAVLSILPGIGAALVWVPAVAYLALSGQVWAALGVGLWCAAVVGTVDNVLRPLLIGKDTEMPDLLVMLSTLGGLALFGFPGMLIGPLIGALYVTVWRLWGNAMDEASAVAGAAAPASEG